ncbi:hypothetical protein [Vibrio mediterranei]|uniref:Uncharacterized protein n=1 Tax=Vibrio mediterranei TaxID=689 RepID=A0A3G4VAB7_9VIBR|nr:hypothetical protein [Vibrio mediterranei]AYV21259.1 hypothetical protein ECB94_08120 [Vibrio mediterranei]
MTFNLTKQTLASSVGLVLALSTSSAMAIDNDKDVHPGQKGEYDFSSYYGEHNNIKDRNVESKDLKLNITANVNYEGAICSFDFASGAGFDVQFGDVTLNNEKDNTLDTRETGLQLTGNGCEMAFFNIENTSMNGKSATEGKFAYPVQDAYWKENDQTWYALGDDIGVWFTTVIKKKDVEITASIDGNNKVQIENGYKIVKAGETSEWHRLAEFAKDNTLTLTTIMNIDHRKYAMWNHTADKEVNKVMSFTAKIQ